MNIQCVSMPRSGHHLLAGLLLAYFNEDGTGKGKRLSYCNYYDCCQHRPCNKDKPPATASTLEINLQKSHDEYLLFGNNQFEPELEISTKAKYLIQIRDPIPGTVSVYKLALSRRKKTRKYQTEEGWTTVQLVPDKLKYGWPAISVRQLQYRKRFLEKWVLHNPLVDSDNSYILDYDTFVASPQKKLQEIITFLSPAEDIDTSCLETIFKQTHVHAARSISDFEFASSFKELDTICSETWQECKEKLGLESY